MDAQNLIIGLNKMVFSLVPDLTKLDILFIQVENTSTSHGLLLQINYLRTKDMKKMSLSQVANKLIDASEIFDDFMNFKYVNNKEWCVDSDGKYEIVSKAGKSKIAKLHDILGHVCNIPVSCIWLTCE